MDVAFVKMEGTGNDYVFVDAIAAAFPVERAPELARAWSDRHFGIGGDGLVLLLPGRVHRVRMAMWNADGTRGAMCGNGLRCVGKLAHEHGHVRSARFTVETDAGDRAVELRFDARGAVAGACTEIGTVQIDAAPAVADVAGRSVEYRAGDAGNPHAVVFLAGDPAGYPVVEVGAALQRLPRFPAGVNVEFVQVQPDGSLRQRTFERGSGETLACGTGAAVAAAAALQCGFVRGPEVPVHLRGGTLIARRQGTALVIEGPARTVFSGVAALPPP